MSTPPTPPSRRDRTRPVELLLISGVLAIFIGLVVLMSTRQVVLALIFLGVAFIVALVVLAAADGLWMVVVGVLALQVAGGMTLYEAVFPALAQVDPAGAATEMARARSEFLQAQDTLRKAPETRARIADELALADGQWVFFDAALKKINSATPGSRPLSELFVASENLLSVMDRVTGLYAALKA